MGRFQYGIEEYALKNRGKLHPLLIDKLIQFGNFDGDLTKKKMEQVRLAIKDSPLFDMAQRRGGGTPAFVMGRTIYMRPNVLNQSQDGRLDNFDLSTARGFSTFAHEVFHVSQFLDRGWWWLIKQIIRGAFRSQQASGIWWDHAVIPMEQEAIEFQAKVETAVYDLTIFTELG